MAQSLRQPYARDAASPGAPSPALLSGGAILLASVVLFLANTRHGVAIEPDTTRYMAISPQAYDAPVYHWLLTGGAGWGVGLQTAALVVAFVTLVANVLLVHGLILRACGRWQVAAVGTALIAFAPQFVGLQASAMSEGPFLSFMLLSMWFFLDYLERARRSDLVLSGVLLGLASLTRFTGPPLGAAMVLMLLLDRRRPLAQRLSDCALLAAVSGALFFAWVGWSQATAGRSIGRALAFNGNQGPAEWRANLETVLAWTLPRPAGLALRLVLVVGTLGFACVQTWRHVRAWQTLETNDTGLGLSVLLSLLTPGYLGFIYLSTTIEANLTFDGRYAMPAYLFLVVLLSVQYARIEAKWARTALLALAALVLTSHVARTIVHSHASWTDGAGYNTAAWRQSPTIAAVRGLPKDAHIYTNGADVVAILTGRRADFSPETMDSRTGVPAPGNELPVQLDRIRTDARTQPVYLVMFDQIDWRFYLVDEPSLVRLLGLLKPQLLPDGRIYRVPAANTAPTLQTPATNPTAQP